MPDPGTLSTVASIIAGFGIATIPFRLQREIHMQAKGETVWLPWADWLVISATIISLLFGVLPLVAVPQSPTVHAISAAAATGACILLIGYPFSILSHYRLSFAKGRTGKRENPEPAEKFFVITTAIFAAAGTAASLVTFLCIAAA
jgi:hypothetical protein